MISIEQLFEEDFKPQWMIEKEARIKESFEHAVTAEVEYKWRKLAEDSVKRISAKYPPCGKVVV